MGIKEAIENIKYAEFIYETEEATKELDDIFGTVNSVCPICGSPIRDSEGFVCTNCNWEIGSGNPVSKPIYKLLYKLLK